MNKRAQNYIAQYNQRGPMKVHHIYCNPSEEKQRAERDIRTNMIYEDGHGYKVIAANKHTFTAGWLTADSKYLIVETWSTSYVIDIAAARFVKGKEATEILHNQRIAAAIREVETNIEAANIPEEQKNIARATLDAEKPEAHGWYSHTNYIYSKLIRNIIEIWASTEFEQMNVRDLITKEIANILYRPTRKSTLDRIPDALQNIQNTIAEEHAAAVFEEEYGNPYCY